MLTAINIAQNKFQPNRPSSLGDIANFISENSARNADKFTATFVTKNKMEFKILEKRRVILFAENKLQVKSYLDESSEEEKKKKRTRRNKARLKKAKKATKVKKAKANDRRSEKGPPIPRSTKNQRISTRLAPGPNFGVCVALEVIFFIRIRR